VPSKKKKAATVVKKPAAAVAETTQEEKAGRKEAFDTPKENGWTVRTKFRQNNDKYFWYFPPGEAPGGKYLDSLSKARAEGYAP